MKIEHKTNGGYIDTYVGDVRVASSFAQAAWGSKSIGAESLPLVETKTPTDAKKIRDLIAHAYRAGRAHEAEKHAAPQNSETLTVPLVTEQRVRELVTEGLAVFLGGVAAAITTAVEVVK